MLKRILYANSLMLGFITILTTIVAMRLTEGMDSEAIDVITKYLFKLNGTQGIQELFMSDVGVMFVMYKINEYSHWIITFSIIWIIVTIYLMKFRRSNDEKKREL